jgi:hypothetical protein
VFTPRYAAISKSDQASQIRLINLLKRWIDLDKHKFMTTTEGVGKSLSAFIASDALPEHFRKSLASALSVCFINVVYCVDLSFFHFLSGLFLSCFLLSSQ